MKTFDEDRLRAALDERASFAEPSPWARGRIDAAVKQRARRRRGVRAATATCAVVVGGAVVATQVGTSPSNDGRRLTTTPADGSRASQHEQQTPPAPAAPAQAPAFVLEAEGFTPVRASDDPQAAADWNTYLQTFRVDEASATTLFVTTAPRSHGIGEGAPIAQRVTVRGREAILLAPDVGMLSLGWREDDDVTVSLRAWGLNRDQLVEAAERLRRRSGSVGWDVAAPLPAGLGPSLEGPVVASEGHYLELDYAGVGHRVTLRRFEGDVMRLQELLDDRLDTATSLDQRDVAGRRAFVVTAAGRTSLLWHADGVVAEVVIEGEDPGNLEDAVAGGIRQVDLDRWKQEAAASSTTASTTRPGT